MAQGIDEAVAAFAPDLPLGVAFSGGADSTALLVACARRWPGQVHAIHVHHGLQAAGDAFERHCAVLCAGLSVPLHVRRVDARHAPGESPEDAARRARYDALADAARAQGLACVALGQHSDDQVETVLLALSRGAGVAGIAGMRSEWQAGGVRFLRPLLAVSGPALRDWLRRQDIAWIEDPTNADERLTRNRIRARLVPAIEAAFPSFRDAFARSARHAAQAQLLLEELAVMDLARTGNPPAIAALRDLTRARQANVLRHWLRAAHGVQPSTAQLEELLDQIAACVTRGHAIRIKCGTGFAERRGPVLDWVASV